MGKSSNWNIKGKPTTTLEEDIKFGKIGGHPEMPNEFIEPDRRDLYKYVGTTYTDEEDHARLLKEFHDEMEEQHLAEWLETRKKR